MKEGRNRGREKEEGGGRGREGGRRGGGAREEGGEKEERTYKIHHRGFGGVKADTASPFT